MSTIHNYMFNNLGRIDADQVDKSQQNLQNTRFANHMLANYFGENLSDSHVKFATAQPTMMVSGSIGAGIGGGQIDADSNLLLRTEQERPLERLQLMQRPFLTVPFLGRGSCDPTLESQLLQGEVVASKKSVSTIMDKSFMGYTLYPVDDKMKEQVDNASHTVEEAALAGWVRGGAGTREMMTDPNFSKNQRPTDKSF